MSINSDKQLSPNQVIDISGFVQGARLPLNTNIHEVFGNCGQIESIHHAIADNNRHIFVVFDTIGAARAALELKHESWEIQPLIRASEVLDRFNECLTRGGWQSRSHDSDLTKGRPIPPEDRVVDLPTDERYIRGNGWSSRRRHSETQMDYERPGSSQGPLPPQAYRGHSETSFTNSVPPWDPLNGPRTRRGRSPTPSDFRRPLSPPPGRQGPLDPARYGNASIAPGPRRGPGIDYPPSSYGSSDRTLAPRDGRGSYPKDRYRRELSPKPQWSDSRNHTYEDSALKLGASNKRLRLDEGGEAARSGPRDYSRVDSATGYPGALLDPRRQINGRLGGAAKEPGPSRRREKAQRRRPPPPMPMLPVGESQQSGSIPLSFGFVPDVGKMITRISQIPVKVNGHFCDVFEGTHFAAGKVALKRPRIGTAGYNEDVLRRFKREAETWARLKHPHILECMGTFQRDGQFYFVSPFIENGNLVEYIALHPNVNRIKLLCETADAITYLHKQDVLHGDVKATNLLIGNSGQVLLCDFGLTRTTDFRTSTAMKGAGTLRWQSPELWDNEPKSFKSDVYAFGMTIVEVLTGDVPFPDLQTDGAVINAVLVKGRRPSKDPAVSSAGLSYEKVWVVAEACWPATPEERISMAEALQLLQEDPSLVAI